MIIGRERVEKALPGYSIGDRLGSGAFGLVLAGHDLRADRPVAIKILEAEGVEQATRGFASEAQVLSGLDHPHVVKAFDYVEAEGLCLVVMELMAGGTLASRRVAMAPEQACSVGLAVAAALGHAHSRGVLHRDIKADNILFASDGTPKVGDFGIAKLFEGSAATASGRIGTPMCMAPEQIEGGRLGPATDLYALGIVLYQLLTGAPPFDPKQPLPALWRQQLNDPPPPMTGVAASVELVVLRALAKAARDRHRDATAFALDLARAATEAYGANWTARTELQLHLDEDVRHLTAPSPPSPPPSFRSGQAAADADGLDEHATIQAEPGTIKGRADQADRAKPPRRRFQLRGSRRRTGAATAAVLLLMAVSLTIWQTVGTDRGTGPDPVAVSRQLAAEASRLAGSQPDLARRMAVAAYRTAPTPQARASVLALLVSSNRPLATLTGHLAAVTGLEYSPDGKLVVTRSYDGTARLWDATDSSGDAPEPLAVLGQVSENRPENEMIDAVFSPNSRLLATHNSGIVQLWDTATPGKGVTLLSSLAAATEPELAFFSDVEFGAESDLLVIFSRNAVTLWDTPTGGIVQSPIIISPAGEVTAAAVSPVGGLVATGGVGTVQLWDIQQAGPLAMLTNEGLVTDLEFSSDGKLLVAESTFDNTVRLWDVSDPHQNVRRAVLTDDAGMRGSVLSPDGKLVATYGAGSTKLWDATASGQNVRPLAVLTGNAVNVVFSPDSRLVATTTSSGVEVLLWDSSARGEAVLPLATLTDVADSSAGGGTEIASLGTDMVFSPDGRLLVTASNQPTGSTARLWDTTARGDVRPLWTLPGGPDATHTTAFSPDQKTLAISSYDNTAQLWDVDPDRLVTAACTSRTNELTAAEWDAVLPDTPYDPPCS